MLFRLWACSQLLLSVVLAESSISALYRGPVNKSSASSMFVGFLENLIKINEMRLDAVNRLTKLQEYTAASDLRSSPIELDVEEDSRHPEAVSLDDKLSLIELLSNNIEVTNQSSEESSTETSSEGSSTDSDDTAFDDLKRSRILCAKTAAKVCKKSCIKAYKSTCYTYKCSKRLKRRARSECKRACKEEFRSNGNGYDSDFSSDSSEYSDSSD